MHPNNESPPSPTQFNANCNKRADLEKLKAQILQRLRGLPNAPGAGLRLHPPQELAAELGLDHPDAEQARMLDYVGAHYAQHLWCVEQGYAGDSFF